MSHTFKPTDLALTLVETVTLAGGTPIIPSGSQVELVARGDAGEEFDLAGYTYRLRRPMWLVDRDGLPALVAERNLMPIGGDFPPERQQFQRAPQSKYELLDYLEDGMDMRGIPV